jgi:hypothetical protein
VFPYTHYGPSDLRQRQTRSAITIDIASDFWSPIFAVTNVWSVAVLRASMKEAAIDEYRNLEPGECNVRADAAPW